MPLTSSIESLSQDIRYGLRLLGRNPGFTAAAVLTLALGIGANTTIFSLVWGVLLRPLPYAQPERIVQIEKVFPDGRNQDTDADRALFWKDHQHVLTEVAILGGGADTNLAGADRPERVASMGVTVDFFRVLRLRPILGRDFAAGEDLHDAPVAIVSYGLWRRHFGGDRGVLNRSIVLGTRSYSIVGVAPPGIDSTLTADVWRPFDVRHAPMAGGDNFEVLGRLRDGVPLSQANAELAVVAEQYRAAHPKDMLKTESVAAIPYRQEAVSGVRPELLLLLGAVGLVLLIACANVANLLLARMAARRREIAVRVAIGAGRGRVLRQLLTESLCLALGGSLLGLLLARLAVDAVVHYRPVDLPRLDEVSVDSRVLLFTLAIAVLTALLFGMAPALQALRADVREALQEGSRAGSREGRRNREALVALEFGVSLVLLIGAALLIQTFVKLQLVEPGFDLNHVLSMKMTLTGNRYQSAALVARFAQDAVERVSRLPGVRAASVTNYMPLERGFNIPIDRVEGHPKDPNQFLGNLQWFGISPAFFDTLGVHRLAGRIFDDRDRTASTPVAIVNQTLARKYFPREDPLGRRIAIAFEPDKWMQIVGVVADMHEQSLDAPAEPAVFVPLGQINDAVAILANSIFPSALLVRVAGDPMAMSRQIADQVQTIDPTLPVFAVRPMSRVASDSIRSRSFLMSLLAGFALLALILAAVGIYGVMSYAVTQRTREIGIRAALGAGSSDILRLVMGRGMVLAGVGMAAGIAGALALTRLLGRFLYGVTTHDPAAFLAAPLVLALVALLACYLPARRATRVDPMTALRYE